MVIGSVLAVVFLLVDVFLPIGVTGEESYVILVLIGWMALNRWLIIWAAVLGTFFDLVRFCSFPFGGFALDGAGQSAFIAAHDRSFRLSLLSKPKAAAGFGPKSLG
ncbi:MAG: hypothetical protein VYC17_03560 [Nitrospinota bacterium]|nr:hypothetical protein [Nitrospinota bacterium]